MKFKVKDLEYTKKTSYDGKMVSMRAVIVDEEDNPVSSSPFGAINATFQEELDKCSNKDEAIALADKYFYNRLLEGVMQDMGVKQ